MNEQRPDQLALEDRLTPEQRQRAQEFARRLVWNLPERRTIEGEEFDGRDDQAD
jgi:hypothetical protein